MPRAIPRSAAGSRRRATWLVALLALSAETGATIRAGGGLPGVEGGGGGWPAARVAGRPSHPEMDPQEARASLDAALGFLVAALGADGSWGVGVQDTLHDGGFSVETYYDYQVAAHALGTMALAAAPPSEARTAALFAAADWLCATRLPKRGSDWDVDYVWSALYGTAACVALAGDARFGDGAWPERLSRRGRELLGILERTQVPSGGWAYYDDPPYSSPPKWATSFCTAIVLPALRRAHELGWLKDERVLSRARDAVWRCALPNGAFSYDVRVVPRLGGESINDVRGSLGRTAACLWGLGALGERRVTPERIREALAAFFEHHRFLDVARMRPIPHEAYYANAGYFYLFAHYYAAQLIELLPEDEREAWHRRLRPHLAKVQYADGSSTDFLHASYSLTAGTAYTALALAAGLPSEESP